MLKKCAVLEAGTEKVQAKSAFMRGAMDFEDFNYKAFNEHILLRDLEKEAADAERKLMKQETRIVEEES
jgi:hypothetical protein